MKTDGLKTSYYTGETYGERGYHKKLTRSLWDQLIITIKRASKFLIEIVFY